ncbi:MAG: hypothetical protein WCN98_11780 [Verrucomicrobiaceae bacterium]
MNSKFTLFFVALFAMPLSSHALVGGPFDNNDYSSTLDNSGVYQTAFRFKNGSGFSQWGNNVDIVQATTGAAGGAGTTLVTRGSLLNRSVIYANGLVYFGNATGMVDHESKVVMGYTNGSSGPDNTAATTTTTTNQPPVTTQFVGTHEGNGTANTEWSAKITQTSPELRYCGTGEITVLSTNSTDVAALINDQLNGTGGAISTILSITDPNAGPAETVEQMIDFNRRLLSAQLKAVAALRAYSSRASSADNGFTQKMTVFGARKFFIGRR